MSGGNAVAAPPPRPARRLLALLPLAGFLALAALFWVRLGAGDPSMVPSPLIGRPVPAFALPPLPGRAGPGLDDAALRRGNVTLVNVFASWCAECHDEHAALTALAADPRLQARGVVLDGIAYKDKTEDTRRYLGAKGDPYAAVGVDSAGRTAIDFGVYGVPETFVVKGDGTIAFKLIGPVTDANLGALTDAIAAAGSPGATPGLAPPSEIKP